MPSKNPRLSVVLSPALSSTLAAIAQETGESASSLVRGLLEQAHPALVRMLQLVTAAKEAKGQIGAGVGQALDRVVYDLEDALAVADSRAGRAVRDLVAEAESVKGRRRRAGAAGARTEAPPVPATPVPVTRGSGRSEQPSGGGRRRGHGRAV